MIPPIILAESAFLNGWNGATMELIQSREQFTCNDGFSMSAYTACMSDQAGLASHAGAFLAPVSTRTRCEVVRVWERGPKMLSLRDSLTAGAFLILYLAFYLTAGFAGLNFIEWAWVHIFG